MTGIGLPASNLFGNGQTKITCAHKILASVSVVLLLTAVFVGIYLLRANTPYWSEGFETGNFSKWDSISQTSGLLPTINTTIVAFGTYSARCVTNGSQSSEMSRFQHDLGTVNNADSTYTREMIYFEKGVPFSKYGEGIWFCGYKNSTGSYECLAGVMYKGSMTNFTIEDGSWKQTMSNYTVSAGQWYDVCFRYDYISGSTTYLALYVNDTQVVDAYYNPTTNNLGAPTTMLAGMVTTNGITGNPATLFVDQVTVSTNYINSYTTTSGVPNPQKFASYIIDVNGSICRLKNRTSGQFDYQSTNATQVFNFAYGNMTSGGEIHVSAGIYYLNGSIYPTSNSVTLGEGESSILSMSNTTAQPVMVLNNVQNVKILYLKLTHNFPIVWGNTTKTMNTYDIQALNATDLEIAYCHVTQAADYAVSIGCVPSPNFAQLPCYNTWIHDNLIENSASDGLHIRGGSGIIVQNNIFNATGDDELGIAGLPWDTISGVTVEGNIFEDGNANAIKLTTEQSSIVSNVTTDQITGINIAGNTINTMNAGGIWIWVPQSSSNYTTGTVFCSNISITDNMISNTNLPAFLGEEGLTGCLIQGLTFSDNSISHCGLNGYGNWKDGTFFYSLMDSIISGNTLSGCGTSEYYAIDLQNCTNCDVSGNTLFNSNGCGIQDANGNANALWDNQILFSGGHGIVVNLANNSLIEDNYVQASGQTYLGDNIVFTGNNGTIISNKIMGAGPYLRYGINVHSGSTNIVVIDNDLRNISDNPSAILNNAGTGTIVSGNIGFVTENSGFQVNCINGSTITHGLAGTPNGQISVTGNIIGETLTVTAASSTTFTLGIIWSNGTAVDYDHSPCTVYWYAQYKQ